MVLNPQRVFCGLLAITMGLILISGAFRWLWIILPPGHPLRQLSLYFDVNIPSSFPGYYFLVLTFTCAVLLLFIGLSEKPHGGVYRRYWKLLALLTILISVNKLLQIHQLLIEPMRTFLHGHTLLYYGWVLPYMVALLVLALVLTPFLRHLPLKIRKLFFVAAALYVGGGVGFQILAGYITTTMSGTERITMVALATHLEELFELTGVVVFVYALLLYMVRNHTTLLIAVRRDSS